MTFPILHDFTLLLLISKVSYWKKVEKTSLKRAIFRPLVPTGFSTERKMMYHSEIRMKNSPYDELDRRIPDFWITLLKFCPRGLWRSLETTFLFRNVYSRIKADIFMAGLSITIILHKHGDPCQEKHWPRNIFWAPNAFGPEKIHDFLWLSRNIFFPLHLSSVHFREKTNILFHKHNLWSVKMDENRS